MPLNSLQREQKADATAEQPQGSVLSGRSQSARYTVQAPCAIMNIQQSADTGRIADARNSDFSSTRFPNTEGRTFWNCRDDTILYTIVSALGVAESDSLSGGGGRFCGLCILSQLPKLQ